MLLTGIIITYRYLKRKQTSGSISKLRSISLEENPASERTVSKLSSVSTVNKFTKVDLNLKKTKKFHLLLARRIAEQRTRCRLLYNNYLSREKWKL